MRKVVARAERTVENIVSEVAVADKIDKSVQRSVAAADDEFIVGSKGKKSALVNAFVGHVAKDRALEMCIRDRHAP